MKVFTCEEIKQGRVPAVESFSTIAEYIKTKIIESPAIISACFLGSFHRGDYDRTSDIEVLVIYKKEKREQAFLLFQVLRDLAYKLSIPLDIISCADDRAVFPRRHPFEVTFFTHIEQCVQYGASIKGNPLSLLTRRTESLISTTEEYIRRKVSKFEKFFSAESILSEKETCDVVADILAFPIYTARKMLQSCGYAFTHDDNKQAVVVSYKKHFPTVNVLFGRLLVYRQDYFLSLHNILMSGDNSVADKNYKNQIILSANLVFAVIDFAEENLKILETVA